MYISHLISEVFFFPWRHLYPLLFAIFPCLLPHSSLSPVGRSLMETSHLGLGIPKSLTPGTRMDTNFKLHVSDLTSCDHI